MDNAHEKLAVNIKTWLGIDKEINILKQKTKEYQKKKKETTNTLISIMKTNEIDCVDISGGQIVFTQNNSKTPITQPYLTKCLNKYFEDEYINNDIGWRRRIITISVEHNYNVEVRDSLNKILSKYHYTLIKENEIDDIYIHNIYKDIVT